MRYTLVAAAAFSSLAFGQHNLNPIGNNGNVLHPGIPLSGPPGASRPGALRSGGGGRPVHERPGGRRSFGEGGAVFVPYPVYGSGFDGFYSGGSSGVFNPAPGTYDPIFGGYNPGLANAGPVGSQPYNTSPTVVINQNFQTDSVRPQLRDYSNIPLPEPSAAGNPPAAAAATQAPPLADDQPTIFLIAMQDHTIIPVIAYWVQGGTLHYISLKGEPHEVSAEQVDRDFSKQLNRERNVPFALPAAR
jgi:hypothetical protein